MCQIFTSAAAPDLFTKKQQHLGEGHHKKGTKSGSFCVKSAIVVISGGKYVIINLHF